MWCAPTASACASSLSRTCRATHPAQRPRRGSQGRADPASEFWSAALGVPVRPAVGEQQFAVLVGAAPDLLTVTQAVEDAPRRHVSTGERGHKENDYTPRPQGSFDSDLA